MFSTPSTPTFGTYNGFGNGWTRAGPLVLALSPPEQDDFVEPSKAAVYSQLQEEVSEEKFAEVVRLFQSGSLKAPESLRAVSEVLDSQAKELR